MPPKAHKTVNPDDLVEALLDSRVIEALAKALSPFIALSIDEALNKKIAGLVTFIGELKRNTLYLQ